MNHVPLTHWRAGLPRVRLDESVSGGVNKTGSDPKAMASLACLVERALDAAPPSSRKRSLVPKTRPPSLDERISMLKASRPDDATLIEEVVAGSSKTWSKARAERVKEITTRHNLPAITGKSPNQRRGQIITLVENAPRQVLGEIADEFRRQHHEGGSLQEWSDIILRDRKRRPD